ncbi:MAG TPA: hypothetical protein VFE63_21430 [Roseiarcus sp.]|jgi:hypothetical protein|nr:hypothetical protein [Roseiarcus sp.]
MAGANAKAGIVVAAAVCVWSSAGLAQQADSPLKSVMKVLGFATDVAPPADFVLKSRPSGDLGYIPVFQPPPEPAKPALNGKELSGVKGALDSIEKRDDALRQAYPPAVKAAAEEAAAKKAKTKPANANQNANQ